MPGRCCATRDRFGDDRSEAVAPLSVEAESRIGFYVTWGVVTAVIIWALSALLIHWIWPDWQTAAHVGDVFGAVNALFSGLALGGVILAIWLQRRELELQRQELAATRAELSRTAKAQEEARAALAKQADLMLLTVRLNATNTMASIHLNIAAMFRGTERASAEVR
jgi:hypothetical protein